MMTIDLPNDPVDEASHGSGNRNANDGAPSDKQILHRPGQSDPLAPIDQRPPEGRRTPRNRPPGDVSE
jgi:hypothetical protein